MRNTCSGGLTILENSITQNDTMLCFTVLNGMIQNQKLRTLFFLEKIIDFVSTKN